MNVRRAVSHSAVGANKRMCLSDMAERNHSFEESIPAPAYTDLRRTKTSMPVRIIRRLTRRDEDFDPRTIPHLSRKEIRKAEKREQRKLEELNAYQRKKFHNEISRQLEVKQNANDQSPPSSGRRSMRARVKDTLRRTRRTSKTSPDHIPAVAPEKVSESSQCVPHVDDFASKGQLQQWFHGPADVEAISAPTTIRDFHPAELDATGVISPYPSFNNDEMPKNQLVGNVDLDALPPPIRSPSPCLSSLPQRSMTIGVTPGSSPSSSSNKQMQCDSCHDAIKMTGFHYACNQCNGGDCLYCSKCVNGGRTCRHDLTERTRNIKRHPTNPQSTERKMLAFDRDSVISSEAHIELSAMHPHSILPPLKTDMPKPPVESEASSSKRPNVSESPTAPVDFVRDYETKRREQEIAFREKEVSLREREATLREREAWTASRERDAALVQQLHAAAMLQQRAEVGSQFSPSSPVARHPSFYSSVSSCSSPESKPDFRHFMRRSESAIRQPHYQSTLEPNITLHSSQKGKKPMVEETASISAMEASIADMQIDDTYVRSRPTSSKRKASADTKGTNGRASSGKRNGSARKANARNRDEEDIEDDDDGDYGSPKRQKHEVASDEPQKLFACPYFKYDPLRYAEGNTGELHYRGCAGGLFRDISRVKQHLKRVHHRPAFYCRRCFEVFDSNEQLQRHSSSRQGCDAKQCPYPERLDETQQARIHVKRPGKDPKELWFEIYSVIFPGLPLPESPYIEQAQPTYNIPDVLENFIECFNRRLDLSNASQPWLNAPQVRQWLTAQMMATVQDLQQTSSGGLWATPMEVSPVSPPRSDLQSRSSSCSSQASRSRIRERDSIMAQQSSSSTPARTNLRPALKVSTHGMTDAISSSASPDGSARSSSHHNQFPKVPRHVREDIGYSNGTGQSWISGDDSRLMADANMYLQEPASATSTRSTKSVSFATPPSEHASFRKAKEDQSFVINWPVDNPNAPSLLDFANVDWSAQNFAHSLSGNQSAFWYKSPQCADSAYGTLSSAQNSRTSLFQPQPQASLNISQEQLTCVDPSKLFVNPATDTNGSELSADVQAYFNRNRTWNL